MSDEPPDPFESWFEALEKRHLSERTFSEVRRSLQALSSLYVHRRGLIPTGAALQGEGKRAAFALFYGPLHFLAVREVVRALGAARPAPSRIMDLGCGTGAAGAAWALEAGGIPVVEGVDRSAWAVGEARWSYRSLGLRASARQRELDRVRLTGGIAILAAFTVNELEERVRARLLERIIAAAVRGARALVVEPIARSAAPWWNQWSASFVAAGGRGDSWRFPARLPPRLQLLDRAAGLDHGELTIRSLYLDGAAG